MLTMERVVIMVPMILLIADVTQARPRRRFCENFPFAPRCLGVAAKRSPEQYDGANRQDIIDIYSNLIKRVLEESKRNQETPIVHGKPDYLDDSLLMERLSALVDKTRLPPQQYSAPESSWSDEFLEDRRGI